MTTEFFVHGNYGTLTVDANTGLVLAYAPEGDGDYHDIFRFDVAEYRSSYPFEDPAGQSVDVLDIGFWAIGERAGYVEAEPDYRVRCNAGDPVGANPRYANYARAQGRTPSAQLVEDRKNWPGGVMCGFVLWTRARLVEASREVPEAFFMGQLHSHAIYDAWLTRWVDGFLAEGAK